VSSPGPAPAGEALTAPDARLARGSRDRRRRGAQRAGVLLARRGYLGRAAAHFERVIEAQPDFAGGYGNLGNVLYEQGKYEQAVHRYEQALARAERPEVHVELALTWCEIGKFDRAREHYRRAMQPARCPGPAGAPGAAAGAGRARREGGTLGGAPPGKRRNRGCQAGGERGRAWDAGEGGCGFASGGGVRVCGAPPRPAAGRGRVAVTGP
jgi:hypothetical protein